MYLFCCCMYLFCLLHVLDWREFALGKDTKLEEKNLTFEVTWKQLGSPFAHSQEETPHL
jgi:hypothetical protein